MLGIIPFLLALVFSLGLMPLVKKFCFRVGCIAQPRQDRWHRLPTPTLGGIGIFLAFLFGLFLSLLVTGQWGRIQWAVLSGSGIVFLIGLYDDFKPMTPVAKLVGQILAAALVIGLGYTSTFFNPRIDNEILAQLPNILLTFIWLVGITNAINLLDNMDGLAGGISLITAAILGYFFWRAGNANYLWIALALAGSIVGFLVFNFPPASIFMGDSGSLFLGFTLAVLAIANQQQASNVFAVLSVPTLLFLLPILDTLLVTFTRLLRGQSPAQGGRDHTSHRLIAFGLNERQTLFVLYGVSIITGVMAAALESLNYWMSLALVPFLVIILALLAAYLGGMKVVTNESGDNERRQTIARVMVELTYRQRLLEVGLDFILIAFAYYLAFLANYGLVMNPERLSLYLQSLPFALASAYIANFFTGVYRGVWRYVSMEDLIRYFQSALGSIALLAAIIFLFDSFNLLNWSISYPSKIVLFFGVFLFLGLAASRSSFKILDFLLSFGRVREGEQRVLIYGAGDSGEMALRWIQMNPQLNYRPVGFVDDDPLMNGRRIHGVAVIGGKEQLEETIDKYRVSGVILTDEVVHDENRNIVIDTCNSRDCWVRSLRLEFELIN